MEGIQKLKIYLMCIAFMSETGMTKCPSCLEKESQGESQMGGVAVAINTNFYF
jgi:hypothetical protein